MVSPDLADHPAIVLVAYIAVFIPWSAVAAIDFINPQWKSVRDSRHHGLTQLFFVVVPMVYILFYIYLQIVSADYKEMSAALAGLAFSLLHLARTIWGLWQLHDFHSWAYHAIETMQILGHQYEIQYQPEDGEVQYPREPGWLADRILVNESLVDNQLSHGEARCYTKYGLTEYRLRNKVNGSETALDLIVEKIRLAFLYFILPLRLLFDLVLSSIRGNVVKELKQVPHQPVDLYLKWAAVFVAQGLKKWLKEFHPVQDPDSKEDKNIDKAQLYIERQEYFASEILASAAFHMRLPGSGKIDVVSPMIWREWEPHLDISDGRATFKELFQHAVESGEGLPFGATQVGSMDIAAPSYKPYARKLEQFIEGLPAAFGDEVVSFGTKDLEWLTVLLFMGSRGTKKHSLRRQHEDDRHYGKNDPSRFEGYEAVVGNNKDENTRATGREAAVEANLALENLQTQLGLPNLPTALGESAIGNSVKSMVIAKETLLTLSRQNRLCSRVGEIIDSWLALVAGEQIEFMLTMDSSWVGNYHRSIVTSVVSECEDEHTEASPEQFSSSASSTGKRDAEVLMKQRKLERARLEFQFAKVHQRYWHIEQSLTFMGYSMECVRSALAGWQQRQSSLEENTWKPTVSVNEASFQLGNSNFSYIGPMSESFAMELKKTDIIQYVNKRSVQVHLLSEIKEQLFRILESTEESGNPSSLETILLCIFSFPSLVVRARLTTDEVRCSTTKRMSCTSLVFYHANRFLEIEQESCSTQAEDVVIEFDPICGPQGFFAVASFQTSREGLLYMNICLRRKENCKDDTFVWQWWRDAFTARLVELAEWQKEHDMRASLVHSAEEPIYTPVQSFPVGHKGLGKSLNLWLGWVPFRAEICLFELQTPGLLTEYRPMQDLSVSYKNDHDGNIWYAVKVKQERVCIEYSNASEEQLKNACFVITDILKYLPNYKRLAGCTLGNFEQGTMMIDEANMLLNRKGRFNINRALLLLEVAAQELGSVEAISRLVEVLSSDTDVSEDITLISDISRRGSAVLLNLVARNASCLSSKKFRDTIRRTHEAYEAWVKRHVHEPEAISEFTGWVVVMLSAGLKLDIHSGSSYLRRAFMYSRDIANVFQLGMVIPTVDSVARKIVNGAESVTSDNKDVRKEEERRVNLRLALLGRAVKEGQYNWAMYFLASDLQRFRKDNVSLRKAVTLFENLIEKKTHVPAMRSLASLLSEGGDGLPKDTDRAIELYERAIDSAQDVEDKVKLADLLCSRNKRASDVNRAVGLYQQAIDADGNSHAIAAIDSLTQKGYITLSRDAGTNIRDTASMSTT